MIIDFHTHTFPEKIAEKVMYKLGRLSGIEPGTNGAASGLAASMREAKVDHSINLPVMTSAEQSVSVNDKLIQTKDTLDAEGIITFGGLHPDNENYKEILKKLKNAGIPGIKLHPAYQGVDVDDIRMERIIAQASDLGMIVLIHAGIDIGIYDRNYASVAQILHVIKYVQPEKFVLAHMGGWACWKDVERDLAGAPVWLDTAFTIGPITPHHEAAPGPYSRITMSDEDFLRLARKHGTDRILFATDSPWQEQPRYVKRFGELGLTEEEYRNIMGENALRLLGSDIQPSR